MKAWLIIWYFLICSFSSINGQCLSADSLYKRIIFLRESNIISEDLQRQELTKYLSDANQCHYSRDSVYMFLLQRLAALISYENNFEEAINLTKRSNQLFNEQFAGKGMLPAIKIKNFLNLKHFYADLKIPEKAIEMADSCIHTSLQNNYANQFTIEALEFKSTYQLRIGDYHGCIKSAELSEYLADKNPDIYAANCSRFISLFANKMNALISLQRYQEVESSLTEMRPQYLECSNGKDLGNWYALLGKLRRRQGKYIEAINQLTSSVNYHNKAKLFRQESESLDNIGYVYLDNLKNYKMALKYFNAALAKSEGNEKSNILSNIGNAYVQIKDYNKGFIAFQQAFDNISPGMDEVRLLNSNESLITANLAEYLIEVVLDKGNAYYSHYKFTKNKNSLDNSIRIYKSLDQFVNKVKSIQSDIQSKLFWREDVRKLYENGIAASIDSDNYEDAFYFFEKSRAVLLADELSAKRLLTNHEFGWYSGNLTLLSKLEDSFKVNQKGLSPKKMSSLFAHRLEAEKFDRLLKERKSKRAYPDITIADVRSKILNKHHAFLSIFSGDSAVYSLVITSGNIWVNRINKSVYDEQLSLYLGYITKNNLSNLEFRKFQEVSLKLYTLLIGKAQLPAGRLVVSLDGSFYPFESLVTELNSSGAKYLIEDHPVSYTYSAQYLLYDHRQKQSTQPTHLMGMAPVNYHASMKLSSLSGSDQSLTTISKYFSKADNYSLAKATRSSFCKNYPKYDIIHLYTHGAYKSDRNEPVLFLADSALYLSELVSEHQPRGKLIVLAACETGLGETYKGEGVFSFSRGFAAMGIPASITTLWSVDKEATFEISELLYKYIANGHPTDIALQKAKLEFLSKDKHNALPYYWAAPVLIGNTDPLMSPDKEENILWLFLSILAATFIAFIAGKQLKRSA